MPPPSARRRGFWSPPLAAGRAGKTLAYLLPLVHNLRAAESAGAEAVERGEDPPTGAASRPKRPRALVLAPTRELAAQIGEVAKQVGHVAKFRSGVVAGGAPWGPQRTMLSRPLDVVVGTPARLLGHNANGDLYLGGVTTLVLDEADTLLDRDQGFREEVDKILSVCRAESSGEDGRAKTDKAQLVLVSATMTEPVRKLVDKEMGGAAATAEGDGYADASTATLHSGAVGARHEFIDVGGTDKMLHLEESLQRLHFKYMGPSIVFCNTINSARAVEHSLREAGVRTLSCHGGMTPSARLSAISEYKAATAEAILAREAGGLSGGADGLFAAEMVEPVLVASDLSARGLDFSKGVARVINFDMPQDPVAFLHRAGRCARAGQRGLVVSLVAKRDRELAQRIKLNLERGRPLDVAMNKKQAKRDEEKAKKPRGGRRVQARQRTKETAAGGRDKTPPRGRGGGRGRSGRGMAAGGRGRGRGRGGRGKPGTGRESGGAARGRSGGDSGPGWSTP